MKICGLILNWYSEFFSGIFTQNVWKSAESDNFHASRGKFRVFSSVFVIRFDCLLASMPSQGCHLGINDPFRLAVRVGVRVVRKKGGATSFLPLVARGSTGMRSEVISKSQVSFDMRRSLKEAVKLNHSLACIRVFGEVAPSRDPELSPTTKANKWGQRISSPIRIIVPRGLVGIGVCRGRGSDLWMLVVHRGVRFRGFVLSR